MPKPFPLAALLRLRRTEQDIAGAELARANSRVRENANTEKRARRALASYGDTATSTETLRAIAAARQAAAAMLSELTTLAAMDLDTQEQAQADYLTARTRAIGLEKTELKHRIATHAAELKAEQLILDEIALTRTTTEADDE